jgi:dimethylamine corrinoid protein
MGSANLAQALGDDFGKDVVATVMGANRIEIIDLAANVEQRAFVDAIRDHQPRLVGMSCRLTTVFDYMNATIEATKAAGLRDRVKILIGGGPADKTCAKYVGADVCCKTAQDGVAAAKRILGVN